MATPLYNGAIGTLKVDAAGGDFTSPTLTVTKFTEDGNEPPKPESIKVGAHGEGQQKIGTRVPAKFQGLKVDTTELAAINTGALAGTKYDVQIVSADGRTTVVLFDFKFADVETSAITDEGKHGFVLLAGESKAYGSDDAYSVTHT